MCGVNGFNFKDSDRLTQMNSALSHRGPDFAGRYESEELSLGHLLLSIRESSELSRQPFDQNPEWVFIYNGQVYNTEQLKKSLGPIDEKYKDLDTYIIYKTIEKFGWNFIEKIHGMFAIALYNTKDKVLRLYRDPTGQKPFYYYWKENKLIFSSELKGILVHEIDRSIDETGLLTAAHLGYIPGEKTLFKYINKLNPSEVVTYDEKKRKIEKSYYKSFTENYFSDDFHTAFEELVTEHLQSKQKVALNLSGGLDSSLLLHEMSKAGHEMHTYSTRFTNSDDKFNRDAELAKKLAKDYSSDHHEVIVTKESYLENFIESYSVLEEPNFNISLPVYLQTAKTEGINGDKNRVILSGNGGDEIFGGYPHYYQSLEIQKQMRFLPLSIYNLIKNYRNKTNYDFNDMDDRWLFFRGFRFFPLTQNDSTLVRKYIKEAGKYLYEMYALQHNAVYDVMLRDRFLWMPGENFMQADKIYMNESLEMRAPLSYHPFRIYCDKKLKEGDYTDKNSNKVFLRKLYKGKLPDYIVERRDKTGWRSPIIDWYDSSYKKHFLEILPEKDGPYIKWSDVRKRVSSTESWPGKYVHLYLSLAILLKKYNLNI